MRALFFIGFLLPVFATGQGNMLRGDTTEVSNLTLTINTDCWPEENTWILTDEWSEEVYSGGPYPGIILDEIIVPMWLETGAYTFTFYDAAGDGMFGTQWGNLCAANGSILLQDAGGNVLLDYDGSFNFDSLTVTFTLDESVGIQETDRGPIVKLYPNPAKEMVFLQMEWNRREQLVYVEVFGTDGKLWLRKDIASGGEQALLTTLDIGHLPSGMYLVTTRNQSFSNTQKLIRY